MTPPEARHANTPNIHYFANLLRLMVTRFRGRGYMPNSLRIYVVYCEARPIREKPRSDDLYTTPSEKNVYAERPILTIDINGSATVRYWHAVGLRSLQ